MNTRRIYITPECDIFPAVAETPLMVLSQPEKTEYFIEEEGPNKTDIFDFTVGEW